MKYAYYPGCVSRGGCPELFQSMSKIAGPLGLELVELKEAACTGAGVLTEKNPELADTLNARTFAMAERLNLPIMTICSTCQGVMSAVNHRLKGDPEYLKRINKHLEPEGLEYKGTTEVKHFLWILVEDYGLEQLKQHVTKPLQRLAVAPFYGCYILRPSWVVGLDQRPERGRYLEMIIDTLGAEDIDYEGKTKCCGFPILTLNEANSVSMVRAHTVEAKEKGAHCIVTPCPLCHLNLDGFQPAASGMHGSAIRMPILHLPQLIGLAMGMPPNDLGMKRHIISTKEVEKAVKA